MPRFVGTENSELKMRSDKYILAPNRPDNLIITIQLPKLQNSKNIKLDVQDRSLTLKTENEECSGSEGDFSFWIHVDDSSCV